MNYNANTKQLEIKLATLKNMAFELRYVLRCIREIAELPMDRYVREGPLTRADHAQKAVLDAATLIGIDFGARWGNELDLRDDGDIAGQNDKVVAPAVGSSNSTRTLSPVATHGLIGIFIWGW